MSLSTMEAHLEYYQYFEDVIDMWVEFLNKSIECNRAWVSHMSVQKQKASQMLSETQPSSCLTPSLHIRKSWDTNFQIDDLAPIESQCRNLKLSRFNFLHELGIGTFGTVYKAFDKERAQIVAIKCLHKQRLVRKNQIKYAIREFQILQGLDSPFIVKLFNAFQSPKYLYLVLEYCCNGDLVKHLEENERFSPETARFYISEVIIAIEHLHSNGIIYRDLKPENILIDETGHIRLVDFGLARPSMSPQDLARSFCGSPAYLCPEILSEGAQSMKGDIYGIGVLLYEMLTGMPPFYDSKIEILFSKIRKGNLRFPTFVEQQERELIKLLLNKDPQRRPSISQIKSHPFFNSVNWEDVMQKQNTPPALGPNMLKKESEMDMHVRESINPPDSDYSEILSNEECIDEFFIV